MSVERQWWRLMAWAAANAPVTAAAVRPPAAEERLLAAQQATGRSWPDGLVELYRLADGLLGGPGGGLLPGGQRPLPVAEVADTWAMLQQVWAQLLRQFRAVDPDEDRAARRRTLNLLAQNPGVADPGTALPPDRYGVARLDAEPAGSEAGMFLPSFLPIAGNNAGDFLFVDTRPGSRHGCVSRYLKEDMDHGGRLWPSVEAMLAEVADALQAGRPVGHWVPVVDGGRLDWRVGPIGPVR